MFKQHVKETVDSIKPISTQVSTKSTMRHNIAKFCKKIGLTKVSDSLMNQVPAKDQSKIEAIEKALTMRLKMTTLMLQSISENPRAERIDNVRNKLNEKQFGKREGGVGR